MKQLIYNELPGRKEEEWVKLNCDERIKPVYEISNYGRVMNANTGKILRADKDHDGYLKFTLQSIDNTKIRRFSHRLCAMQFIPNPENKPEVNHKRVMFLNNKKVSPHDDNYYENLEWCSRQENIDHSVRNGLQDYPGINAIYPEELVHMICMMLEKGYHTKDVIKTIISVRDCDDKTYEQFRGLVKHIRTRKTWKHISKYYNF